MRDWKLLSRYNTLDYGSINETIYSLFIKLTFAQSIEIERSKGGEVGARQEKTGKGQDRIDVPTVMELPGQCRHDFPRDSTSWFVFSSSRYIHENARMHARANVRVYVGYSLSVIILA